MRKTILSLLMITSAFMLHAQMLTLDSIQATIERNNPELQSYDAQASAYTAYANGARAWEAPQIGAGFFMTPYNPSMWKADHANGNTYNGMGDFMIQGQQMIPNPGKQKANQDYMQSMAAVETANKNIVRNELIANAKSYYYEWVILKKKLQILDQQQQLLNYMVKSSEIRYTYGKEKLNSIYKAKANVAELESTRLQLESEMNWKRISLNQLMNRDKSIGFEVDTTIVFKGYEKTSIDTSTLIFNRSDINAIDKNILVYQHKQRLENNRLKPDFGIQYGHMFAFGNNPNLFTLMGMISIPIAPWSSKQYKSNVKGINYQIQGYQKQREAMINEASGTIVSIQWQIASQKQQVQLYEKTMLPALEKNYRTSLLAYEQNTEDLFVVLDAIQALQLAQMELLNKKKELLLLQVAYEKTIEQK